jgi:hypothetical protein
LVALLPVAALALRFVAAVPLAGSLLSAAIAVGALLHRRAHDGG